MGEVLDKLPRTLPTKIVQHATRDDGLVMRVEMTMLASKDHSEPSYRVKIEASAICAPGDAERIADWFLHSDAHGRELDRLRDEVAKFKRSGVQALGWVGDYSDEDILRGIEDACVERDEAIAARAMSPGIRLKLLGLLGAELDATDEEILDAVSDLVLRDDTEGRP